jgi:hypothetical protein
LSRVRSLSLVLVLATLAATLLASSAQGARPRPTRLYYNIEVTFVADEGYKSSAMSRDETGGIVDQRTLVSRYASVRWTAKTNESVLLRRLPDGRVTFISSGASTVRFAFDEYGVTGQFAYQPGWVSSPACEQGYRGGVDDILTTGEVSLSGGTPAVLDANINAPTSELRTTSVTCLAQRSPNEDLVVKNVPGEHFTSQPRASLSGLPGLGWSSRVSLGNNLRLNFGRSVISARNLHYVDLDGVHERDVAGRPVSVVTGHASSTTIVVFTRCPHARPCR